LRDARIIDKYIHIKFVELYFKVGLRDVLNEF
jgi:hypothetical protein